MTDETSKSKRRRWRWITAGVLLLVAVAGWWHWPRGDARLVGRWSLAANGENARPFATWVFHSNGLLEDLTPGEKPFAGTWCISGDELYIGVRVPAPLLRAYSWVENQIPGRTATEVGRFYVGNVTRDRFTMGDARSKNSDVVLKRITE